MSIVVAKNVT